MTIGLPDTLRYSRYAHFWEAFLAALELNTLKPEQPLEKSLEVGARLLTDAPPSVQLFVGRVLELAQHCDELLVPSLNPGAEPGDAGGTADPWMVDLAAVLERRLSLPPLLSIPARLDADETVGLAVRLGHAWTRNPQKVRRTIDRTQNLLQPARTPEPMWARAGHMTVGVAADPTLLETPWLWQGVQDALKAAKLHAVLASDLPRDRTLEAGRVRPFNPKLDTELETIGGAKLLEAKGQVRGVIVLTQARAPIQTALAEKIVKQARKPAVLLEVGTDGMTEALAAFTARL